MHKIKVKALASISGNNSDVETRYYKNKALSSVSIFTVVEPSALVFNEVGQTAKYKIKIKCGDHLHKHSAFENGSSTFYNFANCEMQRDGIKFTVTAEAAGYTSSESREFTYKRVLSEASGFYLDTEAQILSWETVENVTDYVVSVESGGTTFNIENGNKTSYC